MAIVVNQDNSANPQNPSSGSVGTAGSSAPTQNQGGPSPGQVMGVGSSNSTTTTPKAPSSGMFTNLQNYLNANQNAGTNIANQIGQAGQNQAQNVNKQINSANNMIGNQISAENANIAQAGNYAQQLNQSPSNAVNIVSNPNQLLQFQQLYNGTNNASDIQNNATQAFTPVSAAQQNLQNYASQSTNPSGQFQLLQQTLGRGSYTPGQQNLDNLFLQATGNNTLTQLQQNLANQAAQSNNTLSNDQNNITQALNNINASSKGAQTQLQGAVGSLDSNDAGLGVTNANGTYTAPQGTGALGNLQSALFNRMQTYDTSQQALDTQLQNAVSQDQSVYNTTSPGTKTLNLNQQQLNALGLTPGQSLYNVNLGNYIQPTFNANDVTEAGVATSGTTTLQQLANMGMITPTQLAAATGGANPAITDSTTMSQLTPQQMASLGLNPNSPTDLATYQALNQLAGNAANSGIYLTQSNTGNAPGVSLGSTSNLGATALQQAIQNNTDQYNTLSNQLPAQNQVLSQLWASGLNPGFFKGLGNPGIQNWYNENYNLNNQNPQGILNIANQLQTSNYLPSAEAAVPALTNLINWANQYAPLYENQAVINPSNPNIQAR